MHCRHSSGGALVPAFVTPSSKKESVEYSEGVLKVKVKAPPEKGKANKAATKLLSRKLGECELLTGLKSRKKTFIFKETPETLETLLKNLQKKT